MTRGPCYIQSNSSIQQSITLWQLLVLGWLASWEIHETWGKQPHTDLHKSPHSVPIIPPKKCKLLGNCFHFSRHLPLAWPLPEAWHHPSFRSFSRKKKHPAHFLLPFSVASCSADAAQVVSFGYHSPLTRQCGSCHLCLGSIWQFNIRAVKVIKIYRTLLELSQTGICLSSCPLLDDSPLLSHFLLGIGNPLICRSWPTIVHLRWESCLKKMRKKKDGDQLESERSGVNSGPKHTGLFGVPLVFFQVSSPFQNASW